MDEILNKINIYQWHDWTLDKLEIDYEKVIIIVSKVLNGSLKISCNDYIGFSYVGHWDESVIERIEVAPYGNLIDDSLNTVKRLYSCQPFPGGGVKNIEDSWYQVNVTLIDGNSVCVACKSIELNT